VNRALAGERCVGGFFASPFSGRAGVREAERRLFTAVIWEWWWERASASAAHHRSLLLAQLRFYRRDTTQSQVRSHQYRPIGLRCTAADLAWIPLFSLRSLLSSQNSFSSSPLVFFLIFSSETYLADSHMSDMTCACVSALETWPQLVRGTPITLSRKVEEWWLLILPHFMVRKTRA